VDCGAAKLVPDYTGINALRYDSLQDYNLDVDYYLRVAGAAGRILELGSGTGRIALPLARAGCKVCALDNSADMQAVLQSKLDAKTAPLITQVTASMADFDINGVFDLAILGLNTLFALIGEKERKACFAAVHRHLRPGGHFIIDASMPFARDAKLLSGAYSFSSETGNDKKPSFCVVRSEYRAKEQLLVGNYLYGSCGSDGKAELFVTPAAEYHPSPGELRLLLEGAGFEIAAFDCDYAGTPFADASARQDMVVTAISKGE